MKLALANGLTPIFCIGEVLEEREADKHFDVVKSQIEASLFDLSSEDFGKIVLAYEPVWAIGTGKTATAAQAQEMHRVIRKTLAEKYGNEIADNTSILYGGSANAGNAKELFSNPDVDGGLIAVLRLEWISLCLSSRHFKLLTEFHRGCALYPRCLFTFAGLLSSRDTYGLKALMC